MSPTAYLENAPPRMVSRSFMEAGLGLLLARVDREFLEEVNGVGLELIEHACWHSRDPIAEDEPIEGLVIPFQTGARTIAVTLMFSGAWRVGIGEPGPSGRSRRVFRVSPEEIAAAMRIRPEEQRA